MTCIQIAQKKEKEYCCKGHCTHFFHLVKMPLGRWRTDATERYRKPPSARLGALNVMKTAAHVEDIVQDSTAPLVVINRPVLAQVK